MKRLSGMMTDVIKRREVLRAARAQRALRDWEQIVGPLLAARSHPDRFDQGTVWVSVTGSAWAQELRLLESDILAKIAQRTGDPHLVVSLRFGVRPLPEDDPRDIPRPWLADPELEDLTIAEIKERTLAKLEAQKDLPKSADKKGPSR